MSGKGEVVSKRYKIQTKDSLGEWIDFGPFCFKTLESTEGYLAEYSKLLQKARLVEVTETVMRYVN